MIGLGVHRYYRERDARGDEAGTSPGARVVSAVVPKLAERIVEFVEAGLNGKPQHRSWTIPFLLEVDPHAAAYIAARTTLNAVVTCKPLASAAGHVGSMLDNHVRLTLLGSDHPGLLNTTLRLIQTRNRVHRQGALRRAAREAGVSGLDWSQQQRTMVGMKLIDLLLEVQPDMAEIALRRQGKRTVYYVEGKREFIAKLEEAHERCAIASPVYMPMLVPPRDWTTPTNGGYLDEELNRQVNLVRVLHRATLDDVFSTNMPEVYDAVNSLQRTPWRVNQGVFKVFETLRDEQSQLAGLPFGDDEEPPARPADIPADVPLGDLSKDQQKRLKAWKVEAAAVYQGNAKRLSKRLGMVQTAYVAATMRDEEEFYFPYNLDFRGRLYSVPTGLTPQGDDLSKGLLEFARGKPLGEDGAYWLAVHVANVFGEADKLPLDERVQWTLDNEEAILDSGLRPLDGARFWATADGGDTAWTALAACREWTGYVLSGRSPEYVSHLPIAMDGSCSGLQHFSAMLRDSRGAAAVNLLPDGVCHDIYSEVAAKVELCLDDSAAGNSWRGKVVRKVVKQPCMTFAYSVTSRGMRDQIIDALNKLDDTGNYLDGLTYVEGANYLAPIVEECIRDTVVAAAGAMDWLQKAAEAASAEDLPIMWSTPTGFPVVQDRRKLKSKQVKVWFQGERVRLSVAEPTHALDKRAQRAGIAPNFVHSMDAAHLMRTVNAAVAEGIEDFAMIHDSFGCHAADTSEFNHLIRREFVRLYEEDVLAKFKAQTERQLLCELPDMPEKGDFELESVMDSDFFFA